MGRDLEQRAVGHSIEVLLKVYAKYLDGHDEVARRRVQEALGHRPA